MMNDGRQPAEPIRAPLNWHPITPAQHQHHYQLGLWLWLCWLGAFFGAGRAPPAAQSYPSFAYTAPQLAKVGPNSVCVGHDVMQFLKKSTCNHLDVFWLVFASCWGGISIS